MRKKSETPEPEPDLRATQEARLSEIQRLDDFLETLRHGKRGGHLNIVDMDMMYEYFEKAKISLEKEWSSRA